MIERIEKLRKNAVSPVLAVDRIHLGFYPVFLEMDPSVPLTQRYAVSFSKAMDQLMPEISEGELLVGKCYEPLSKEEREQCDEYHRRIGNTIEFDGQDSHMAIDYELLLQKGISGIIDEIDGYMSEADADSKLFYQCCKECLNACVRFSNRYAQEAERQAELCGDESRRQELLKIAKVCRNVPEKPASSFYEALQSVHFISFCLSCDPLRTGCQQFQLGHPDRYLYPFYVKDKAAGILTDDQAQEMLDCLGIMINVRVTHGLSSGYMVGGRNAEGQIIQNELTYMCMQVVDDIRLVYPAVGLCYTRGMDDKVLEKACEILSHGCSHPAIFNDDLIVEGLKGYGVSEKEAHEYIHSTCVEITPVAASNNWVASPYTNLPQILLDVMDKDYDSYDEMVKAYFKRLSEIIKLHCQEQDVLRVRREQTTIHPLISCFVNDCLKKGKDVECGGARYNWIMPSFVGMANLIDSFFAIRTMVYEEKRFKLTDYLNILKNNFEGNEALRLHVLGKIAKYGNDLDEVDALASQVTRFIVEECKKYRTRFEGRLVPSVFCWIMHEYFGSRTGATPDGRSAGFPLGDGSGPCQGREMNGPTASVLSSTKWSHRELIGGVAVNMKFSKKVFSQDSCRKMQTLIQTYLERGGFEIQINVIDRDTLLEAQKHPDQYEDLVVRIGGYSDYFVRLSKNMQEEVLLRTEHEL